MLTFASASAALSCAVELERAFDSYSTTRPDIAVRVRIGLHTGNVFQERDDVLGRTVIVAARITGQARGGEVLVSALSKEYTEHLGRWRFGPPVELTLKGISTTQRVHALHWNDPS
jgi:class 3 adenylate cyclase